MIRRTDIAWAAGLIDGEGSVKLYRGRIWLRVVMTDLPTIERLRLILGGTVHNHAYRPPRKRAWCWYCRSSEVEATLRKIRLFSVAKAAEIDRLLGQVGAAA